MVLRGPERLTALGIDGALRWTSEPLHDDGAGVVRFEGDTIACWTDRDAVRIDPASGAFLEALDEARPAVDPPASRIELNGWLVNTGTSGLYVKSPDGRRWTTPADVAQEGCAAVGLGEWIVWAQTDGTVYAIDTTIKTPVTAVQDLGLTLR